MGNQTWTYEMDARLKECWASEMCMTTIGKVMGISRERVCTRAHTLGLPPHSRIRQLMPSKRAWVRTVNTVAIPMGVEPRSVLVGCRKRASVRARWEAFQAILDAYPRISIAGLARVSGFDHTTILHGLARLRAGGYGKGRVRPPRASGRRPSTILELAA